MPSSSVFGAAQAEATIDTAIRQAEAGATLEGLLAQGAAWECRARMYKARHAQRQQACFPALEGLAVVCSMLSGLQRVSTPAPARVCFERSQIILPPTLSSVFALTLLQRMGDKRNIASALEKALEIRRTVVNRTRGDPEEQRRHQVVVAGLCFQLAGEVAARREYKEAVELYESAQKHDPPHVESTLALARLHVANDDKDAAEAQCNALLALDPAHDEATLMLANIMFQKEQFEAALFHFEELLKRNPHHYGALSQLVTLLRRAGRIPEIAEHIRTAEKSSLRAALDAGMAHCKGLAARAARQEAEALAHFNRARKDGAWALQAVEQMIDIYLAPHASVAQTLRLEDVADEQSPAQQAASAGQSWFSGPVQSLPRLPLGSSPGALSTVVLRHPCDQSERNLCTHALQLPRNPSSSHRPLRYPQPPPFPPALFFQSDGGVADPRLLVDRDALVSAQQLVSELRGSAGSPARRLVLEAYCLIATRNKEDAERACAQLAEVAAEDPENVPVLLALATGFMSLRQAPKARNQLKRIAKMQRYVAEDWEEFEKAWLMLAELQLAAGKHDQAQEMAKRCLLYNKSSGRAFELLGQMFEREQARPRAT